MRPSDPNSAREGLLENQAFLRRLARSLVADPHGAEDLLQDAAVIALERPPVREGTIRGWLARVVRNRAIDTARRETWRRSREDASDPRALPWSSEETEEQLRVQRRVLDAVSALDEPYRTSILLRYYQDLSPTAVADRLGVPVATVKSRLARALARLREQLDDTQPEGGRAWVAVLAGGLGELHRPAIATTLAAGGIAMGVKLAFGAVTVAALGLGGWWLSRPGPVELRPVTANEAPLAAATALESPGVQRLDEVSTDDRSAVSPAEPVQDPAQAEPKFSWMLTVELRGWSPDDRGPIVLRLLEESSSDPVLTFSRDLASSLELDLETLFSDPNPRPDQLIVELDHPDFLPATSVLLVPEELRQPQANQGRLAASVDLVRAKAVVTGSVTVPEGFALESVRAAIFALENGKPAEQPIECVHLEGGGRFRLRADVSPEHVVAAFLEGPPGFRDVTLRPETRRLALEANQALELEPIVLGVGECIEGRVVIVGGGTPPRGRIEAEMTNHQGSYSMGMVWRGERLEVTAVEQPWSETGEFRLTGLGPQAFRVVPTPIGNRTTDLPLLRVADSKSAELEVDAPASGLTIVLDSIEIVLGVRGAGEPVAGATVRATWKVGKDGWSSSGMRTDALGRVAIQLDPQNGLDLEITDPRWPKKELELRPEELSPFRVIEVQLEGEPVEPATLAIHFAGDRADLTGVVVDLLLLDAKRYSSEELEKARKDSLSMVSGGGGSSVLGSVHLQPDGPHLKWKDVGGAWVLADLPPSRYLARITPRAAEQGAPCLILRHEFELELEPGKRVEHTWQPEFGGSARLNLTALESLKTARLIDEAGVEVAMNYCWEASSGGYSTSSVMLGPGLFNLIGVLVPGTYQLSMNLEDGSSHQLPLRIESGKVVDVTVGPDDLR